MNKFLGTSVLAVALLSVSAIALEQGPFTADQSRSGRALYVADVDSLDASVNYNLMRDVSVTFDAVNLTDKRIEEYYDNDPGRPARFYKNGRTFFFGLHVKY